MATINDFEISERSNKMYIKYIGTDPNIDKCVSELNPKFAPFNLIKTLQSNATNNAPEGYEESNKRLLIETGCCNHIDVTKLPLYIPKQNL